MDNVAKAKQLLAANKEAGTAVTSVSPHGPGGLFSYPGLGGVANASLNGQGNGRSRTRPRAKMCKVCQQRKAVNRGICSQCLNSLTRAKQLQGTAVTSRHSKASTQFDMPAPIKAQALLFASRIDREDLINPGDEWSNGGIETDTHVTVKYGVRGDMLPAISRIAADTSPLVLRFGGVSLFTSNPDFDVVKVDVESNDLRSLNGRLAALPGSDNSRPFYNPHLTIAYVRKGAGQKYVGSGPLVGQEVTVNQLSFLDENGNKTILPLAGSPWVERTKTPPASFSVFKDADGRYRWVAISSNSYRDRDQEIVSQKALEADVEYADRSKEYGPLRFWHVPGWDLGSCDFNMMHGRMLIESGTFKSEPVGAAVAQAQKSYQLSIGFTHPRNEPNEGVYYHIRRFERSLVPSGRAANPFTSLSVMKETNMLTAEKEAQLRKLLGDPDLLDSVLSGAAAAQKQADDLGVAFKEYNPEQLAKIANDPAALLDYALKNYEAAQKAADEDSDDEDDNDTAVKGMGSYMKKMDEYMAKMDGYMSKISSHRTEKGRGDAEPKADPDLVTADAQAATKAAQALTQNRVAELEKTVKELTDQLDGALGQLKSAREDAPEPAAFTNGNRPTQDASNVKEGATAVKETDPDTGGEQEQTAEKSFEENNAAFFEFFMPTQP